MRVDPRYAQVLLAAALSIALPAATRAGCFPDWEIPDDGYNGSLGSMICCPMLYENQFPGTVDDVDVTLAINHSWIGDLVIKVESPASTVRTLQSRAVLTESADDGSGCCGDSSNWTGATIRYDDESTGPSSETMGSTLTEAQSVCTDDGVCSYKPSSGAAPPGGLDGFDGQSYVGYWNVCVGDASGNDIGEWDDGSVQIKINRRIPCACNGKFRGGDRVRYLPIVGPADDRMGQNSFGSVRGPGITPAPGTKGEVMCGYQDEGFPILVSWEGFGTGHDGNGFCQCPTGDLPSGDTSGWWVYCENLGLDLPWMDDFESGDTTHWSAANP